MDYRVIDVTAAHAHPKEPRHFLVFGDGSHPLAKIVQMKGAYHIQKDGKDIAFPSLLAACRAAVDAHGTYKIKRVLWTVLRED